MNLRRQYLTQSDCYRTGRIIRPRGVMVHSTGADNPNIKRYVQPDDGVLGENANNNDWNRPGINKCVHAFIGKLADGSIAAYQTLPWNHRGWHCGGDGNNTHISFEICEDGLDDREYFEQVYREAVELTAHLCRLYGLDPGEDGVVLDHHEGYQRGLASGHGDVAHWFPRFGRSMDDFRADVKAELNGTPEEDEGMTQEKFNEMMDAYLTGLAEQTPAGWSEQARDWAETEGLIQGDENGDKKYKAFVTREQMAVFLYRLSKLLK